MWFSTIPFLQPFLAFMIGTIIAHYDIFLWTTIPFYLLYVAVLISPFLAFYKKTIVDISYIRTVWLWIFFSCFGHQRTNQWLQRGRGNITTYLPSIQQWEGIVCKIYLSRKKKKYYKIRIHAGLIFQKRKFLYGNTVLFTSSSLTKGDIIKVKATMQVIKGKFTSFWTRKHIFYQSFAKHYQIKKLGKVTLSFLEKKKKKYYNLFEKRLEYISQDKEILGLGQALFIGNTQLLPDVVKSYYRETGTAHILARSGFHLMLLTYFLQIILWLLFGWWLSILIPIGTGVGLLTYIWITTGTASLWRVTFTWFFAQQKDKNYTKPTGFPLLCATAFFSQFFFPYYSLDIGFWLSYTAVATIHLLVLPIIKNLPSVYFPINIWLNITVFSLLIQWFTAPILLIYFGSFPSYFLLANWLAIPVFFIIFLLFFLLLLGGPFSYSPIKKLLLFALKNSITTLHKFLYKITNLPMHIHYINFQTIGISWLYAGVTIYLLLSLLIISLIASKK